MNRSIANWLATNPGGAVLATGLLGLLPFFGVGFFFFLPGAVPALLALARGPRDGAIVAAAAAALLAIAIWFIGRSVPVGLIYASWVLGPPLRSRGRCGGAARSRFACSSQCSAGLSCSPCCTLRSVIRPGSGPRWCASLRRRCSSADCPSTMHSSRPWRAASGAGSRCSRCCSGCAGCSSRAGGSVSPSNRAASAPNSARSGSAGHSASLRPARCSCRS